MKLPFVTIFDRLRKYRYVFICKCTFVIVVLKTFLTYRSGYVLPIRKNRAKEQVDLSSSN